MCAISKSSKGGEVKGENGVRRVAREGTRAGWMLRTILKHAPERGVGQGEDLGAIEAAPVGH